MDGQVQICVLMIVITAKMMVNGHERNGVCIKASLRIFAEADVVTRMLTQEINLQVFDMQKEYEI